jgi:two-component system NarL family response regulator
MTNQVIRVLLVEDDEVFRLGVTVSLKQYDDIQLVGTCSDGQSAVSSADLLKPDIILMDIGLPVMTGIDATRIIKDQHPEIKILVLTSHSESKTVDQIIAAGADGYCLKGIATERLYLLITDVSRGVFWIDPAVADQIKRYLQAERKAQKTVSVDIPIEGFESLTEREQEVLGLIAAGKKNNDIAEILCISPGTVRVHVHSILSKLNVKDRTQAALFMVRRKEL